MPLHIFKPKDAAPYLTGERLIGDDATPAQLKQWFDEEMDGYADLVAEEPDFQNQREFSAALNRRHYGDLFKGTKDLVGVVYGPATATELTTLTPHVKQWYAVEPGKVFHNPAYYQRPVTFLPVGPQNTLELPDNSVDVVICLSVLHHIANAGFAVSEMARVLKPGGLLLLREPTVTMGDWSKPRPGLTRNERGFPLPWLLAACKAHGLDVFRARQAVFPPLTKLVGMLGGTYPFSNRAYVALDTALSVLTAPFARYHRPTLLSRFAPSAVLLAARKKG